jgi:hypothetical protein
MTPKILDITLKASQTHILINIRSTSKQLPLKMAPPMQKKKINTQDATIVFTSRAGIRAVEKNQWMA